jgi:two-component system, OmpR family, sensor kinase
MAVVLAAAAGFVYLQLRHDLFAAVDMGLRSRAQVIVAQAARPRSSLRSTQRPLIDADEAFAQVLRRDGRVVETTRAVAGKALVAPRLLAGVTRPTFVDRRPPGLDPSRLLIVPARLGRHPAFVVVGATLSNTDEELGHLADVLAVAFPAALVASSLVGWLLAAAALRPVERMRQRAAAITASDPGGRLPVPATDDTLARLATTLNATFDRLQVALERERRFVDDASHELRTPLTVLKAEVDSALEVPRTHADLERALQAASAEVEHLVRIAEGLLVLARSGEGRVPVRPEDTDLYELLDASRRAFAGRAAAAGVRLDVAAPAAVVHVDPTRTRQALDNLVDNAIHHTPAGGAVEMAAYVAGTWVTIAVRDAGPGFDADVLEQGFAPFTRAARPGYDGSGLGLAIVSAIARAHGGAATAENLAGGGAQVTIRLAAAEAGVGTPRTARAAARAPFDTIQRP